jgi:hypothetical protein
MSHPNGRYALFSFHGGLGGRKHRFFRSLEIVVPITEFEGFDQSRSYSCHEPSLERHSFLKEYFGENDL